MAPRYIPAAEIPSQLANGGIERGQAFGIGLIFTVIALARMYVLRRWFNARLQAAAERLAARV